jgi:prepilin-type N-terminal cleavage/methylation domain-containing protein
MSRTDINAKDAAIRKSKKDEGYSILEVLIAISIFAVGMLAVAAMQTSAIKVNSTAGQISERATWGQDKMEELLAKPYNDSDLDASGNPHQETTSDGFTVQWSIIDPGPVADTKRINVTVTGRGKTSRFSCIKAEL